MTFAAFSTVLAVFENIVSCVSELTGWNRKKTCLICCIAIFLLSLPCVLGYNVWQNVRPIAGRDVLDSEDFLVSNLLLPLGSLLFVIFCTARYGWGWEKFMKEANEGKGLKVAKWMRPYMTYVLPVMVAVIFVVGMVNFFSK
jgi:NSS family neurotransmitter:Na+ symporter